MRLAAWIVKSCQFVIISRQICEKYRCHKTKTASGSIYGGGSVTYIYANCFDSIRIFLKFIYSVIQN